jgi:hypothetical protein
LPDPVVVAADPAGPERGVRADEVSLALLDPDVEVYVYADPERLRNEGLEQHQPFPILSPALRQAPLTVDPRSETT